MGSGQYINPLHRVFLNLSGGTVSGDTLFTQNLSATTFFSGATNLGDLISNSIISIATGATRVQNGLNTYTGGTQFYPSVNISGLTVDNIIVSGASIFNSISATTISGGTLYSGTTELSNIFQVIGSAVPTTLLQNGTNTFTGGTTANPTINVTALTISNIQASGVSVFSSLSSTTISGGTLYSGSTELGTLFSSIFSSSNDITRVQPGLNTYTGGTGNLPTVNVSALTINTLDVSGNSIFTSLSATSFSGGTIYSGSTDLNVTFNNIFGQISTKYDKSGGTITGDVYILGNVEITGTATTINTETIQSKDNNITLNFSGTHITAIGGGITLVSGQTSGSPSIISSDSSGNWVSNVDFYAPAFSSTTVNSTNILSGGTNLNFVFAPIIHTHPISGITNLQGELDTKANLSGATFTGQIVSPSFSATTLSGGTIFSGSTPLQTIIQNMMNAGDTGEVLAVQNGLNTYTGGTSSSPSVNVSGLTVQDINASGSSKFASLSASSFSASSIFIDAQQIHGTVVTSTSPVDSGSTWIRNTDYTTYIFDSIRGKWLSVSEQLISGSRNVAGAATQFLRHYDSVLYSDTPYRMPYDATLTKVVIAGASAADTWRGVVTTGTTIGTNDILSLGLALNTYSAKTDFNIPLYSGQSIYLAMSGASVNRARVDMYFRQRGS